MAPLIDMVFLLLIYFAVTSSFSRDAKIDLERPVARSGVTLEDQPVRVSVQRSGALFLEDRAVSEWTLQSLVRDELERSPSRTVLVTADRLTPTEKLVDVVDQCRLAGAADVGVAVAAP